MPNLVELLGETLQSQNGTIETHTLNETRFVAFYFAASSEPNCTKMLPNFINYYHQLRVEQGKETFEVVFVSSDNDIASFENHYAQMPWLTLKYDKEAFKNLFTLYQVVEIPCVILLNKSLDIVTRSVNNYIVYPKLTLKKDYIKP